MERAKTPEPPKTISAPDGAAEPFANLPRPVRGAAVAGVEGGVGTDFRYLGRTDDPTKVIGDFPANGTLKVKVEAADPVGLGEASAVATIDLEV